MDQLKIRLAEARKYLKIMLAESGERTLVAGSYMFLVIAFFAAMAVPKAALLPLALGVGCYLLERKNEAV
ncbi:hypothetical protein [Granulosicoccus antarcticus]|uniref:Uncharacterized protein n=1 Tax=Granulosicoccus antarcticus IMCC3135 TaxID=1192854 RepID=A0A2Z2NUC7_9GAMM|nr:hypothetical protein [Granulosicoccus antarcticus]ASJ74909.1 hypothetical protein IMCC3135_24205 [Granulosicoccus antarcticus IMCC3135]